jgi:hypothetical protein
MGKGEQRLVDGFRDFGFGAYRYPQPAINIKDNRPDYEEWRKIARQQPVDVVVNGRVNIDGLGILDIRLGIEEKTCSGTSFSASSVTTEQRVKWLDFCSKNCMVPVFVITFSGFRGTYFYYNIGFRGVPREIKAKYGFKDFSEFAKSLILEISRQESSIESVYQMSNLKIHKDDKILTIAERGEIDE